ncbi:methyl-accepting chemotaxis protein [Methylobacterium sp. J-090]|uniref:methyl-accepting chemotaxis protein n=1 Tax=Methylobacterium sp. J-090 TaxID=2836666 RepID=UPI001FB9ED97|nr:methyl-accepting chemotaxis protein [Methylobacterium sp. J-090]MCJ2080488.1 methyl-accepting chemotaxis protein [Methylobacterium sp. J-090]
MLGLPLTRFSKNRPVAESTPEATPLAEDIRLTRAVERLMATQDLGAVDLPDGPLKTALGRLQADADRTTLRALGSTARVAREASEAATNTGWMTYDVGEVARATQTIAGATEEMAASIAEVAQTSDTVVKVAEDALSAMQSCIADGGQARGAMQEIEGRTIQIADRVVVLERAIAQIEVMATAIAAISSQTNLLALNATIEAARAGEAGRGFSVVAAEVKSLSAQTAKSTGEIRSLLTTLTVEMGSIAQAVSESRSAVAAGRTIVDGLETRVSQANDRIGEASELNRAIAHMLGQQRQATAEISTSVQNIAGKASKTHEEIEQITKRLVKAEALGQKALDTGARTLPAYALVRLPADIGAWKRKLARVLVGLAEPDRGLARLPWNDGLSLAGLLRAGPLATHPALPDLLKAEAKAFEEAERMITALAAQNWDVGTPAYRSATDAMKTMLDTARIMLGESAAA